MVIKKNKLWYLYQLPIYLYGILGQYIIEFVIEYLFKPNTFLPSLVIFSLPTLHSRREMEWYVLLHGINSIHVLLFNVSKHYLLVLCSIVNICFFAILLNKFWSAGSAIWSTMGTRVWSSYFWVTFNQSIIWKWYLL